MRKLAQLSLAFTFMLLVTLTAAAQPEFPGQGPNRAEHPAFKGVELYAWPTKKEWCFRLMWGTNRNKTKDEIRSQDVLYGVEQLKDRMAKLAPGENLFWHTLTVDGSAQPPSHIITDLKARSEELGLNLQIF